MANLSHCGLASAPSAPNRAPSQSESLAQAFSSFREAAWSLESFYAQLQVEISALRRELEERNSALLHTLQENKQIRAYLASILEALPCGVLVADADGVVRIENAAAQRLLSLPLEVTTLQIPQELQNIPVGSEHEWPQERQQGCRELMVSRAPLLDPSGGATYSVLILRDATDEKRWQREQEAARRVRALADMATLLAHEIRNPLASLELFAGLLAGVTHGEPRRWADQMRAGLRTLSATVNNVLEFHTQAPLQKAWIPLFQLLVDLVEFLLPLASQHKIEMKVEEFSEPIVLHADPHRLRQALMNLLLNSVRIMTAGGIIRIAARRVHRENQPSVQIRVQDEGPGIDPENREKIFEPGFTTRPGSPGLGLAVAKRIVEQHGGKITAESSPGQGTTFCLEFPMTGDGNESSPGR